MGCLLMQHSLIVCSVYKIELLLFAEVPFLETSA